MSDVTVTRIDDTGPISSGSSVHDYFVTVDYGNGLVGKHLDVNNVMVTLGQKVKQGDVIVGGPRAEFMLIENNRADGERTGPTGGGSYVRPWKPALTNPSLFHDWQKGAVAGEWILTSKGWHSRPDPSYYDLMTIFDVTNTFGHWQHVEAAAIYVTRSATYLGADAAQTRRRRGADAAMLGLVP